MMIYRRRTILLAVLLLPVVSSATTWVDVAGSDEVTVFVDRDSLRRSGSIVKSWLQWKWGAPQEVPGMSPAKTFKLEKQLQISDCSEGTLAIAQGIRYADDAGLNIVDSYVVPKNQWEFSEAAPETNGESIIRFVCKNSVKRKQ
jgi:hypothetical protein